MAEVEPAETLTIELAEELSSKEKVPA